MPCGFGPKWRFLGQSSFRGRFWKKRDFSGKKWHFGGLWLQSSQKSFPNLRLGHPTSASLMRVTVSSGHAFKASCLEWSILAFIGFEIIGILINQHLNYFENYPGWSFNVHSLTFSNVIIVITAFCNRFCLYAVLHASTSATESAAILFQPQILKLK